MPSTRKFIAHTCLAIVLATTIVLEWTTYADAAVPREVKRIAIKLAADTAVPPSIALAVASVESGFRDDLESSTGARAASSLYSGQDLH